MKAAADTVLHAGVLLPESILHSEWFGFLGALVAINTLIYAALALAKILPKLYLTDWTRRRDQRAETRSIHPDTHPVERPGHARGPIPSAPTNKEPRPKGERGERPKSHT
jgi:hypothetical protein